MDTIQGIFASSEADGDLFKSIATMEKESLVDVFGTIVKADVKSDIITKKSMEIQIHGLVLISKPFYKPPFSIEDATRTEDGDGEICSLPKVSLSTRLDNRVFDLRTITNHAIFRIQSGIALLFREFLDNKNFIEIHSPKLISTASEGGSNVFKLKYFDSDACLAQSPQLYKQSLICADFERVYEIGPIFRAENSMTHRHMTEFTGLDIEMTFENDYHEVVLLLHDLLVFIFKNLSMRYQKEIAIIKHQYPCEDFLISQDPVIIPFNQGIQFLRETYPDETFSDFEDLNTENEKKLGKIIRNKFNTDFYVLDKFPLAVRPFYTMVDHDDDRYSNSYDFFMRGEEILSGSQRCHDYSLLLNRIEANGLDSNKLSGYLDSFKYGAPPHAGGGIGLERVAMFYLNLKNIRKTSLFPRDPHRITP